MTESPEITDQELLGRLANWIVTRRLTAPAILFLRDAPAASSSASQAMVARQPHRALPDRLVRDSSGRVRARPLYRRFANIIEDRDNVERLIIEIEASNQDSGRRNARRSAGARS